MLIRKLASTAAVATLAFAGPALANQDMEGSSPEHHGATQYDSTDKEATNQQQGAQDVQMTVKEIDRTANKVTFEADLSSQASIQGENQEKLQLSELSEGDEVRASFDPLTGDITKLEVVKKGDSGSQQQSPDIVPGQEEPTQPSEPGTY